MNNLTRMWDTLVSESSSETHEESISRFSNTVNVNRKTVSDSVAVTPPFRLYYPFLVVFLLKCLSGVWGFYIFEIFGYSWETLQYILSAEKFIFLDFFAVKVDGYMTSNKESVDLKTSAHILGLTSVLLTLTAKKVLEDKIFGWQDILQFFSWASEDFKYIKSPNAG